MLSGGGAELGRCHLPFLSKIGEPYVWRELQETFDTEKLFLPCSFFFFLCVQTPEPALVNWQNLLQFMNKFETVSSYIVKFSISHHFSSPFVHIDVTTIAVLISKEVMQRMTGPHSCGGKLLCRLQEAAATCLGCSRCRHMSLIIRLFLCISQYRCLRAQQKMSLKLSP